MCKPSFKKILFGVVIAVLIAAIVYLSAPQIANRANEAFKTIERIYWENNPRGGSR